MTHTLDIARYLQSASQKGPALRLGTLIQNNFWIMSWGPVQLRGPKRRDASLVRVKGMKQKQGEEMN